MKLLAKMLALVATKFEQSLDKQGQPYMLHCLHVMNTCGLEDEISKCIALGHDLVEDTDVTYDFLVKEFNYEIAAGINNLTCDGDYDTYIRHLALFSKSMPHLIKIKLADLRHNMDASRLKGLSKKDFDRMEKYMRSYTYLKST